MNEMDENNIQPDLDLYNGLLNVRNHCAALFRSLFLQFKNGFINELRFRRPAVSGGGKTGIELRHRQHFAGTALLLPTREMSCVGE